jgi:hypothetical protein
MQGNGGHGEKFGRRHEQAVVALLTEPTVAAAAIKVGVSEASLTRWMRRPEFQAAFRAARRQVVETAVAGLQGACGEAVATLRRNLNAQNESIQVRAAVAILDYSIKAVELIDLAERVEALEATQRRAA